MFDTTEVARLSFPASTSFHQLELVSGARQSGRQVFHRGQELQHRRGRRRRGWHRLKNAAGRGSILWLECNNISWLGEDFGLQCRLHWASLHLFYWRCKQCQRGWLYSTAIGESSISTHLCFLGFLISYDTALLPVGLFFSTCAADWKGQCPTIVKLSIFLLSP